jgi:hypothetical protein
LPIGGGAVALVRTGYVLKVWRYKNGGGGVNIFKNGKRRFGVDVHKINYVLIAFHVCLKENAVPICPGADLFWYRFVLIPNCLGAELSFSTGAEMSWCQTVVLPVATV